MSTFKRNAHDQYITERRTPRSRPSRRVIDYNALSTSKYVEHEEGSVEPLHIGNLNDIQIASIKNNQEGSLSKNIREKIKETGSFSDKDINSIVDEYEKYYGDIEARAGTKEFYQNNSEDGTHAELLFARTDLDKIEKRDALIKTIETFVSSDGKTVLDSSNNVELNNVVAKESNSGEIDSGDQKSDTDNYFYDDDLVGEDKISPYDLLYLYRDTPVEDLLRAELNNERARKLERNEQTDHDFSERLTNIINSYNSDNVTQYNVKDTTEQYNQSDQYLANHKSNASDANHTNASNALNVPSENNFPSSTVQDYFRHKHTQNSDNILNREQIDKLNNIRRHTPTSTAMDMLPNRRGNANLKLNVNNNAFDKFSLYIEPETQDIIKEKNEDILKKGVMAKALGKI